MLNRQLGVYVYNWEELSREEIHMVCALGKNVNTQGAGQNLDLNML